MLKKIEALAKLNSCILIIIASLQWQPSEENTDLWKHWPVAQSMNEPCRT